MNNVENTSNARTCLSCGWVAFEVSREYAEAATERFNEYFDELSKDKQMEYYGGTGASVEQYERCMCCRGSYRNFRDTTPEEESRVYGCTLNPIIKRDE